MLRRVMEAVLSARVETRLKLWVVQIRLWAAATGSSVELDVHPTVRVGRRVRVQFDRGTANRLSLGPRTHLRIPRAGHNLPQEEPEAFSDAVMELVNG